MKNYRVYDCSDEVTESESDYKSSAKRKWKWIAIVFSIVILMIFVTVIVNNIRFDPVAAIVSFFTHDLSTMEGKFVWNIDLPILLAAFISGAALSLAGEVMQCILKNPLASPFTLGLSNAAAFGAAFSILFLENIFVGTILTQAITPIASFVMTLIATGVIILLTKITSISAETMVLAGIAVSAIFSALITLMQYLADPSQLSQIVTWMFGSVSGTTWNWDLVILIAFTIVFVFFYYFRWTMNAMGAGDEVAKGLGVNTNKFLIIGLIVASLLSALIVCKFGVIAFVGLLGPHIARLIVGNDHRYLMPMSVLIGGLLLMVANIISVNICYPMVLPIGVITAIVGAPLFVVMIIRRYRA